MRRPEHSNSVPAKTFIAGFGLVIIVIVGAVLHRHNDSFSQPSKVVQTSTIPGAIRYSPLGDSYTIGQSVVENQRWPNQLAARLKTDGTTLQIVANPSVTGYTTQDLIRRELPLAQQLKPDIVSVLVGVNDYVQGQSAELFHKNLITILDNLQRLPGKPTVFLVTIPDYSKTPTGSQYGDPVAATQAMMAFNDIITQEALARNIVVADIFSISQMVTQNPTLTADDGLHPSGIQYALWADLIYKQLQSITILQKR